MFGTSAYTRHREYIIVSQRLYKAPRIYCLSALIQGTENILFVSAYTRQSVYKHLIPREGQLPSRQLYQTGKVSILYPERASCRQGNYITLARSYAITVGSYRSICDMRLLLLTL